MTSEERTITTFVDADKCAVLDIEYARVRDQLILIRDAVHAIRTDAVREIKVHITNKDWSIMIEARK